MKTYRWGLIGSGYIVNEFALAHTVVGNSCMQAVVSARHEKAKAFAEKHGIPVVCRSVEELVGRDDIDCVYIGTPNSLHASHMRAALEAGKHVFCEKPITIKSSELKPLITLARKKGLLLTEALWTRFLPVMTEVKQRVEGGLIGDLVRVDGNFGFRADYNPENRFFNRSIGGGALLDTGVYVLSLARFFLGGAYQSITADSLIGPTGVDHHTDIILQYPEGRSARLYSALDCDTRHELILYGTKGSVLINRFWSADSYVIRLNNEKEEKVEKPFDLNGHEYIMRDFLDCLERGPGESETQPLSESLAVMEMLDEIMNQTGLVYDV